MSTTDSQTGTTILAHRYAETLARKRRLEAEAKEAAKELETLDESLVNQMLSDGVEDLSVSTEDGRLRLFIRTDTFVSVSDQERLCDALIAFGEEGMVKTQVNNQTLRAWVRETEEREGSLPGSIAALLQVSRVQRIGTRSL
jgi:hypothetical protein